MRRSSLGFQRDSEQSANDEEHEDVSHQDFSYKSEVSYRAR